MAGPNIQIIRSTIHGSRLFGFNKEDSDYDIKQVFLPTKKDIILGNGPQVISRTFPSTNGEPPTTIEQFRLDKYLKMLSQAQPVALEIFFSPDGYNGGEHPNWLWNEIRTKAQGLFSKQVEAFVGYCVNQATVYCTKPERLEAAKTTHEYLNRVKNKQMRIGELESLPAFLQHLSNDYTKIVETEKKSGDTEVFLEVCNRKIPFGATVKHGLEVTGSILSTYGKRVNEIQDGVDWKSMCHAVRVGVEALEFLKTGKITLPLKEREYLFRIRSGEVEYNKVKEDIINLLDDVREAKENSSLPDKPNLKLIEEITYEWFERIARKGE